MATPDTLRRFGRGFRRFGRRLLETPIHLASYAIVYLCALFFAPRGERGPRARSVVRLAGSGARVLALAVLVALAVLAPAYLCFERVPPATVAVRQVNWGADQGIGPRDYATGLHFGPKGSSAWHHLDARTHFVSFAWESEGGDHPPLEVRTKEGNTAQVAVTVPYKIRQGEAHRIVAEGLKTAYPGRVKATVEKVLLQELAQLTSADFADTDARLALAGSALAALNELLAVYHVEAEAVLVSGVYFPATFEKKLQEKQLESQKRLTDESLARRHERKLEGDLVANEIAQAEARLVAQWDRRIEEERIRLEQTILDEQRRAAAYERARKADGQFEFDKLVADGDLALARAEALRDKLAGEALETPGGRLFLAREAATNLRFSAITLNSNDPRVPSVLDLDGMIALLVGAGE